MSMAEFAPSRGVKEYNVLPLDVRKEAQWQELFDISESTAKKAKESYDRTMKIVGDGLEECQKFFEITRTVRLESNQ